jgi:hypothetical protein
MTVPANQGLEKTKYAGGRPRLVFDLRQVEDLGKIQSTHSELAAVLGCSLDTVKDRLRNDPEFSTAYQKGLEHGKSSLRRIQWKNALGGNTTMQIWLGKQYLGQSDRRITEVETRQVERWQEALQKAPQEVVEWLAQQDVGTS